MIRNLLLFFFNPIALLILEIFYQYTVSYTHTSPLWNGEW